MAWYMNHYECDRCSTHWHDEWSCKCDDKCPNCNAAMCPDNSENLTVVIEGRDGDYFILQSSDEAEHDPDYKDIAGPYRTLADAAAARSRFLLG